MAEYRIVEPNTSRIVEGFRDTGYSFDAAVADLIDNSIEAGASIINVVLALTAGNEVILSVQDDGHGMNVDDLENAMKYGAAEKSDVHRLGRFGLGLKTASTSFCRRLTVISRNAASATGSLFAATWDLDLISEKNEWLLEIGAANAQETDDFLEALEGLGGGSEHGTVVLWRKVDRVLRKKNGEEYKDPASALARRRESLEWHIRTVFQRFLDPRDIRARDVEIRVNGEPQDPWDPFCEAWPEVACEKDLTITIANDDEGIEDDVIFRAFILPKENQTSDVNGFKKASRVAALERQGFFVYRENRLVDEPGWINLWAAETHMSRLRIEVSFPATLDSAFGVGLKKSGLHLEPWLAEELKVIFTPIRREANNRSRAGNAGKVAIEDPGTGPTDRTIGSQRGGLETATVIEGPDGSIEMGNNHTGDGKRIVLRGPSGQPGEMRIDIVEGDEEVYVDIVDTLEDGVLWAPAFRSGPHGDTQVRINARHDWFTKAYLPIQENNLFCQSVNFLLFALAQAELNNTNPDLDEDFRQFRIEVSRNLRRLVSDMSDYDSEDS
ncbi:Histidine kinase-, DNA gyrase B-, and HSP90-like ATPase [Actinobacteria bacterium IMCC26256]|nr:Histidine kinase-, DNA gyrase B-, and HSP90-like ATPase [Actinobacteria bacterium IMCC26256]